jgi:enoyl-CoA hydratase/carnithine racemase
LNPVHLQIQHPAQKVVQITLSRPRQFNALNQAMIQELSDTLADLENSQSEFVILTGAGRAFCFGADFTEFENRPALPELLTLFQRLITKLYYFPKITIAVLNGFATGAGLDLALACDFRIAAENVKLGEAYISMGLVPDGGGTFFLPGLIGTSRALELLLSGESISAQQGFDLGIIHRVAPAAELNSVALSFIDQFSSKPKTAREWIKKIVKSSAHDLHEALRLEREAQLVCFEDEEHRRITLEFLQKKRR